MKIKKARIEIRKDRCKGCRLCIIACPKKLIDASEELNDMGYHPAEPVRGEECTGCGLCYLVCPEPGCITVFSLEEDEE